MARITIDCADPSDLQALEDAAERAAGRCNIIYARQAQALIEAGTVKSERQAAAKIATETGEPVNTVRSMISRGKQMDAGASTTAAPKQKKPKNESAALGEKDVHESVMSCLHALIFVIGRNHPGGKKGKAASLMRVHATMGKFLEAVSVIDDLTGIPFTEYRADPADVLSLVESWSGKQ